MKNVHVEGSMTIQHRKTKKTDATRRALLRSISVDFVAKTRQLTIIFHCKSRISDYFKEFLKLLHSAPISLFLKGIILGYTQQKKMPQGMHFCDRFWSQKRATSPSFFIANHEFLQFFVFCADFTKKMKKKEA